MMLPFLDILRKPVVHPVDGLVDPGVAGVLLFCGGEGLAVASVEALGRGVPAWEHGRIDEATCASFVVAALVTSDGAVVNWSGLACLSAAAASSGLASPSSSSSSSPDPEIGDLGVDHALDGRLHRFCLGAGVPRDKLVDLLRGVGADRFVLRLVLRAGLLSKGLAGVGRLLVEEVLGLHLELVALALQDRLDELDAAGGAQEKLRRLLGGDGDPGDTVACAAHSAYLRNVRSVRPTPIALLELLAGDEVEGFLQSACMIPLLVDGLLLELGRSAGTLVAFLPFLPG